MKYRPNHIKHAFAWFEATGKRYTRREKTKLKIYPKYAANRKLIKETNYSWNNFRCPDCGWRTTLRTTQGWPSHLCKSVNPGPRPKPLLG